MKHHSDCCWRTISPFSKFFVNCVQLFNSVYCNFCVPNDNNGACWCTCSLVTLVVLEICFWKICWRNLSFFEMHTRVGPGAQMLFRHNWRKLVTAALLVHCIGECVWVLEKVFSICGSGFKLKFSGFPVLPKRLQIESRIDLTLKLSILQFLVEVCFVPSNSYLHGFHINNWRQLYFLCKGVFHFSLLGTSENFFDMVGLPAEMGNFTFGETHLKKPLMQFTCKKK